MPKSKYSVAHPFSSTDGHEDSVYTLTLTRKVSDSFVKVNNRSVVIELCPIPTRVFMILENTKT